MLATKTKSVKLSNGRSYSYQLPWDGRTRLRGSFKSPISFDTETELINEDDPTHIPRLALATASDGYRSLILTPEQVSAFIQAHAREHWLGQNMAFDFWVVHQHLITGGLPVEAWWRIADEGRLHDTILLDMLIRLAQAAGFEAYAKEDTSLSRRNLDVLAREYCNLRVDKEDPFRLRYGELIGRDWVEVTEEGFWSYAIQDAIVTQLVYRSQIQVADRILQEARRQQPKDFLPNCHITWGYLTESLQTRASLVLQSMQRRGMRVNPGQAVVFEQQVREQMQVELQRMWEAEPQVFTYRQAKKPRRRKNQPELFVQEIPRTPENIIPTKKAGTPSMATKVLAATLQRIANEAGIPAPQSDGKKKGISLSAKAWTSHRRRSPFVDAWVNLAKLSKSLGFFAVLHDKPVINPRYNVLMRTGRTSCTKPNLQQFPRDSDFRSLFIPRDGYKLLTVDYCLHPQTLVKTVHGDRPIGDIRPGDKVFTLRDRRISWGEVTRTAVVGHLPAYRIVFDNGESVVASSDHRWPVRIIPGKGIPWQVIEKTTSELRPGERMIPCRRQETPSGYVHLYAYSAFEYSKEHVLVAEAVYGPRPQDHHVHHINENKHDNRPENLEYLPKFEHLSFHGQNSWTPERRQAMAAQVLEVIANRRSYVGEANPNFGKRRGVERNCLHCDKTFYAYPSQQNRVYCSRVCYLQASKNGLNHRVISVEYVGEQPMVAITVDSDHNYVLSCGVVTSNCYIELRTLAVVCEQRFGKSQLADVIRQGVDPHVYTAAMMRGLPVEEFRQWKDSQPAKYKDDRQKAKVVNFGVPGGLGAVKLAAYARASYGVDMTVEEAAQLRYKLVTQVYPELDLYLADTSLSAMAWNFGVSQKAVRQAFHIEEEEPDWVWRMLRAVGKVVRGKPQKADGTPYKEKFVARIWAGLKQLSGSSARLPLWVKEQIKQEKGTPKLEQVLCCGPAVTMTGRVRGSATYTQARNTPFQSLAADGGKLALWDGLMAGFKVVAFIHDEVLVELPEATAEEDARRFEAIMVRAMEKVMNFRLPIACEFHVGDYWQKG